MSLRRTRPLLALLAVILVTGIARADTLAFTGTLSLQLDAPNVPPFVIPGSGVASLTPGGGFHLSSFALAGGTFGPATMTFDHGGATVGPAKITGVENLSGAFTGTAGGPPQGGVMGLVGVAKLCFVFDGSCNYVLIEMPLSPTTGGAGFGIGGTVRT